MYMYCIPSSVSLLSTILHISIIYIVHLLQYTSLKQEAQGLGALLDNMEDNDHIKLDNIEIYMI